MPDLPDVFNRVDFIGILSPGYVATILWLVIFHFEYLTEKAISFDILSAVIFVVAGPAVGLTLRRINHAILSIIKDIIWYHFIKRKNKDWRDKHDYKHKIYAKVRLSLNKSKRLELDMPAAYTDFEASLGIAFIGFALIGMNEFNTFFGIGFLVPPSWCLVSCQFGFLLVVGIFFYIGAYLNHKVFYVPIYKELSKEFSTKK